MDIKVRWADNTKDLASNLKEGVAQMEVAKAAAEKMAQSLQGDKLIQSARNMAAAIKEVGGTSTLTASQLERANSLFERAGEKLKLTGQGATYTAQAFKDLARETASAVSPLDRLSSTLGQIGPGLKTVGTGLTIGLTAPLVALGVTSLKASTDFETAFAGVRKTVSGTPAELAAINVQFREMAKVTPATAVELARIGEQAGQLGVQKDKITAFTKTIVDITSATHLTAEEAGASFAKLANVMKLPQDQFSNLGSAVVALGNFGASTEQEMLSMAQRISAAGASSGIAAPQILGIANALSSVGIEAEAGGTAISRVIAKMAGDVDKGGGKLQDFARISGMTAAGFQKAWKDDAGLAFAAFMQGLSKIKDKGESLFATMDDLGFKEIRLRNAMLSAANAGELMSQSIELGSKSFRENTELARASEERYKTTANQLAVLKNNVTDAAISLGEALLPSLIDAVNAAKPLISTAQDAAKWFKELPEPVRLSSVAIGGVAIAAGPAIFLTGQLAQSIVVLIPLMKTLGNTSAATALKGLAAEGTLAGSALGMLKTAALALGAFWVGWEIGTVIGQFTGLTDAISRTTAKLLGYGDLSAQVGGAKQDVINLAIKRGADAHISYGAALEFNNAWFTKYIASQKKAAEAAEAGAGSTKTAAKASEVAATKAQLMAEALAEVAQANKAYHAEVDGLKSVLLVQIANMDKTGKSAKDLADKYKISEDSVKRLMSEVKASTKTTLADHKQAITDLISKMKEHESETVQFLKVFDKITFGFNSSGKAVQGFHGLLKATFADMQILFDKMAKLTTLGLGPLATGWLGDRVQIAPDGAALTAQWENYFKTILEGTSAVDEKTDEWATGLDAMAKGFQQLGSISGGSLGGILKDMGSIVISLNAAQKAEEAFAKAHNISVSKVSGGIAAPLFSNQASNAEKGAAALASVFTIVAGVQNVGEAVNNQETQGGRIISGAQAGAQAGAAFGPYGAAFGALAGAAYGWFTTPAWVQNMEDVGRNWGVKISRGLSEQIIASQHTFEASSQKLLQQALTDKQAGKIDASQFQAIYNARGKAVNAAPELMHIGGIIQEDGGLNAENLEKYASKLKEVFTFYKDGVLDVTQATKILDDNFGTFVTAATSGVGLLDKTMVGFIADAEQAGLRSKSIGDYLGGQATNAANSFGAALSVTANAMKELAEGSNLSVDRIRELNGIIDATSLKTQGAASAIGAGLAGAFSQMINSGASFEQAIASIKPGVDALGAQLVGTGMNGGAAFTALQSAVELASDAVAGPALTSVNNLALGMVSLSNMGMLNQETFGDLSGQINSTFDSLTAQGKDGATVMFAMQTPLQQLWELQDKFGFTTDTTTQKLIDQAKEAGIVGPEMKKPMDQLLDVMREIRDTLQGVTDKTGGLKSALNELPTERTFRYTFESSGEGVPEGYASGSGGIRDFGRGTVAILHGREAVVTERELQTINQGGGSISTAALEKEIKALRAELLYQQRRQPQATAIAMADALVTAGIGRRS